MIFIDKICLDVEVIPSLSSPFLSGNWAVMVPVESFDKSKFF